VVGFIARGSKPLYTRNTIAMDAASTTALVTSTLTSFGTSIMTVLTAVIGIGVAYLVFRVGWRKVKGSLR